MYLKVQFITLRPTLKLGITTSPIMLALQAVANQKAAPANIL